MVVPIIVCGREKRWSTPTAWASEAKGESFFPSDADEDDVGALLVADADKELLASAAALALAAADDRLLEFSSEAMRAAASSSSSSSLARATKEAAEEAWRCE